MKTYLLLISLLSLFQIAFASDGGVSCGEHLMAYDSGVVAVGRGRITGPDIYSVQLIQERLEFTDPGLINSYESKRVLSLGEGYSSLVPQLRLLDIDAYGFDLWYGYETFPDNESGRLMKAYVEQHVDYLIAGNAKQTGLEDESFDLILSHLLVNNLEGGDRFHVLKEACRLLKPGGELRIYGFNANDEEYIRNHLKKTPGTYEVIDFNLKPFRQTHYGLAELGFLHLRKLL